MLLFLGYTPLMIAADGGNLEIVKFLFKHGANVNDMDNFGKFLIPYCIE